jgi:hypothetical protein
MINLITVAAVLFLIGVICNTIGKNYAPRAYLCAVAWLFVCAAVVCWFLATFVPPLGRTL